MFGSSLFVRLVRPLATRTHICSPQWVQVCEPFHFPSSFTNKSFVIKKLYVNALHHYEQVYFLRREGPVISPPCSSGDSPTMLGTPEKGKRKLPSGCVAGGPTTTTGFYAAPPHVPNGGSCSNGSPISGVPQVRVSESVQ